MTFRTWIEIFDQPLPWRWLSSWEPLSQWEPTPPGEVAAGFEVGDDKYYEVYFTPEKYGGGWSWLFKQIRPTKSVGVTRTGSAPLVFATVMDIAKEFVRKYKPKKLSFDANAGELSRQKLYNRMVDKFAPEMGFKFKGTSRFGHIDPFIHYHVEPESPAVA
jgi:hypothetical protein